MSEVWNTTGVLWSQFQERYPQITSVNDVALFDLIEIPVPTLEIDAGWPIELKVKDDGSFGGREWIGHFEVSHPMNVDPEDDRLMVADTSRIGMWLVKVVADDGTTMTV